MSGSRAGSTLGTCHRRQGGGPTAATTTPLTTQQAAAAAAEAAAQAGQQQLRGLAWRRGSQDLACGCTPTRTHTSTSVHRYQQTPAPPTSTQRAQTPRRTKAPLRTDAKAHRCVPAGATHGRTGGPRRTGPHTLQGWQQQQQQQQQQQGGGPERPRAENGTHTRPGQAAAVPVAHRHPRPRCRAASPAPPAPHASGPCTRSIGPASHAGRSAQLQ